MLNAPSEIIIHVYKTVHLSCLRQDIFPSLCLTLSMFVVYVCVCVCVSVCVTNEEAIRAPSRNLPLPHPSPLPPPTPTLALLPSHPPSLCPFGLSLLHIFCASPVKNNLSRSNHYPLCFYWPRGKPGKILFVINCIESGKIEKGGRGGEVGRFDFQKFCLIFAPVVSIIVFCIKQVLWYSCE